MAHDELIGTAEENLDNAAGALADFFVIRLYICTKFRHQGHQIFPIVAEKVEYPEWYEDTDKNSKGGT